MEREYVRKFVLGHNLFREANSFPRAKLEENCELRGTDNVQGQISVHMFEAKWRLLCLLSLKYFYTGPHFGRPFLRFFTRQSNPVGAQNAFSLLKMFGSIPFNNLRANVNREVRKLGNKNYSTRSAMPNYGQDVLVFRYLYITESCSNS